MLAVPASALPNLEVGAIRQGEAVKPDLSKFKPNKNPNQYCNSETFCPNL